MSTFYIELKEIRTSHHITLEQISDRTKINIKFLTALEEGNFDILPEPYIRLFFKAYAKEIGVDPREVVEKFDEFLREKEVSETAEGGEKIPSRTGKPEKISVKNSTGYSLQARGGQIIWIVAFIIIGSIVFLKLCTLERGKRPSEIKLLKDEKPAVKQQEELSAEKLIVDEEKAATLLEEEQMLIPANVPLNLSLKAKELTWVRVIIDDKETSEYMFRPGQSKQWTAGSKFQLRIGKSMGVELFLNGNPLPELGPRNTMVWKLVITRKGIEEKEIVQR
ncbi:MAG: helix-turn-helix domain-containing protein [Fidelibacterota bacterium]